MNKLCVILLAGLFIISCKPADKEVAAIDPDVQQTQNSNEQERIRNTIVLYNALLAKGYRTQDMTVLSEAATEERALKAYYHMAALGEGKVRMDSKLLNIVFNDLQMLSDVKANVDTSEKWDYQYINFDTQSREYENTVDYKLKYSLVKQSGKWFVDDIQILETIEKNPESYKGLERQDESK